MKRNLLPALLSLLVPTLLHAQLGPRPGAMGGPASGPSLGGSMARVFGEHKAFSAAMVMEGKAGPGNQSIIMPGEVAFDEGKSRFAMDMTQMKGGMMPPGAAEQMKAMGMDRMTMITRPDTKVSYMVYPGMSAYMEMPVQDGEALKPPADFKMETTELGKETIDGHPCVKNKAIVTDADGTKHEYTIWNATGLRNFPIKIETVQEGKNVVLSFKDVKLSKPAGSQFDPPADFKKYGNMQEMMQDVMMKRFGAGAPGNP